jgi:hypothetical protein
LDGCGAVVLSVVHVVLQRCSWWCRLPVLTRDTWVRFGDRFRTKVPNHGYRLFGLFLNTRKVSPSLTEYGEFLSDNGCSFRPSKRSMLSIENTIFDPVPPHDMGWLDGDCCPRPRCLSVAHNHLQSKHSQTTWAKTTNLTQFSRSPQVPPLRSSLRTPHPLKVLSTTVLTKLVRARRASRALHIVLYFLSQCCSSTRARTPPGYLK